MKKKSEKRKREEEKEDNETETVKRRCEGCVSVEAFEIFSQGRDLESYCGLSWEDRLEKFDDLSECQLVSCALVRVVPDVTDVLVSPSSVVTEFCDVEPQSFPFFKKRALCKASTQEEMRYEGSQVKALPITRRRMTLPTLVQNSFTFFERDQGSYEEGRSWDARERTIIARTKQYLERSYSVKVRFEELEGLRGPEDVDVDLRRILKSARDERGGARFSKPSVRMTRVSLWLSGRDGTTPWREDSSVSASDGWRQEVQEQLIVQFFFKGWWMQRRIIWKVAPLS